jgi:hypothetical protein
MDIECIAYAEKDFVATNIAASIDSLVEVYVWKAVEAAKTADVDWPEDGYSPMLIDLHIQRVFESVVERIGAEGAYIARSVAIKTGHRRGIEFATTLYRQNALKRIADEAAFAVSAGI